MIAFPPTLFSRLSCDAEYGCALLIRLSPDIERLYVSQPAFDSSDDAKNACAEVALSEGVLDFVKQENGLPFSEPPLVPFDSEFGTHTTPLALQTFYESLPRPLLDKDNAYDVNAISWLNSLLQSAKGAKLGSSFYFTSGTTPGCQCLSTHILDHPFIVGFVY